MSEQKQGIPTDMARMMAYVRGDILANSSWLSKTQAEEQARAMRAAQGQAEVERDMDICHVTPTTAYDGLVLTKGGVTITLDYDEIERVITDMQTMRDQLVKPAPGKMERLYLAEKTVQEQMRERQHYGGRARGY